MTERFVLILDVKVEVNESFQEMEETDPIPQVERLYEKILRNKSLLHNFIKLDLIDQLLGNGFNEEILEKLRLVPDEELIRRAAMGLDEDDRQFFSSLGEKMENKELMERQDTVVQSILEQFNHSVHRVKLRGEYSFNSKKKDNS